jgi:hypothetical protein
MTGAGAPVLPDPSRVQREDQPAKGFDQTLPLNQVAEAYRAMDEPHAIKTIRRP